MVFRQILEFFRQVVAEESDTMLMVSHDNLVHDYVDEMLQMSDGQIM